MTTVRQDRLSEFTQWATRHIRGDEKGEAQIFLDRLFKAFGQPGVLNVGGQPEFRIRKAQEDGGGVAFADYVWKPIVLIEMKKRGTDLSKHYRQALDYWIRLAPDRPQWVVLCNFDEFWIYDFDSAQIDTPLDTVSIAELPARFGPLAFLFPSDNQPVFGNDHEAVTREAADRLATCFNKLISRKVERRVAQRFILQMLVALFAKNAGLLDTYLVTKLLDECREPADGFDLLGGLFVAMNTPGGVRGGRYKGVEYFNGGLFAEPAHVELYNDELHQLREAAKSDWSKVRPEIFGTLFEHSLDHEERHAFGAHFTAPVDIMKIVGPTIVEPWREQIEAAKSRDRLRELLERLQHFTVLDPACGSGNFLYMAYREMKRLEARLFERLKQEFPEKGKHKAAPTARAFGFVTARQFHGLDISPFAVELAKVTMMIARKLAIDELHVSEPALPLDNLDKNFVATDALIDSLKNPTPTPWPKADVIIGNPPFLGAKLLKPERGPDYVNAVRHAYPDVPGMADYCVYWFRKAHDHLPACTKDDPLAGRAGLVGTQNIRNNQSRVGGLDHIAATGTIIEAVDNQPWSGEANVHVSIANWIKTQDAKLLPKKRRLWFKVEPKASAKKKDRKRGSGQAAKEYELDYRDCSALNSALSDQTDVSGAESLRDNGRIGAVCQGITPGHNGFVLSKAQHDELLRKDARSRAVIFPYLVGRELLTGDGTPTRYVIDFDQVSILDAQQFKAAFAHIRQNVLPDLQTKASQEHDDEHAHKDHLQHWWWHWRSRREMIEAVSRLPRFLVCSRVTKRPIFVFVSSRIRPGDALQGFAFADDYSFGILQANAHWRWFVTKCSKLTERFRYTPESVFDTFPWPQSPSAKQIEAVAKAGREVRRVRAEALAKITSGLRAVYRTLELPGANPLKDAHAALDTAVLAAYGFSPKTDLLAQLLDLNHTVANRIHDGHVVTAPGIPLTYPKPETLVTSDCISP
jgi:SAM-dependent methyltransferase